MSKYNVYGVVSVSVSIEVEAENEEQAMEKAFDNFGGIDSYVGNGGTDKLIGVKGSTETITCDTFPDFLDAEKIED